MKKVLLIEHIHPVGIERLKKESDVEVSICISLSKLYEEIADVDRRLERLYDALETGKIQLADL